jgi:hypothetical protein
MFKSQPEDKEIDFSEEAMQKAFQAVKDITGAVGVCIALSDDTMPCADVRSGEKCHQGGHEVAVYLDMLTRESAIDIIKESADY